MTERGKWLVEEMDYDRAVELVATLKALCGENDFPAQGLIAQHEREDYAEALRVVMEYLP